MKKYTPRRYPISDHCDGRRFFNPSGAAPKQFKDLIAWKLRTRPKLWPTWIENNFQPNLASTTSDDEIVLTFINHVTFLIQTAGLTILTDPVFSKRVSPSQQIGPKRIRLPGLAFSQLPKIDLVVISHNHYDHLDLPTVKKLARVFQPLFVTPLGNGQILKKAGATHVVETDWWQVLDFYNTQIITVPAQHWSTRGLRDQNRALWSGFVLQTQKKKIYFAGDTGYSNHFKEIYKKLGAMDLALLPIGAYEPRWFMRDHHMNPEESVQAHLDLHARLSIAMHFGTFQLTDEGFEEPLNDLKLALDKYQVTNFSVLEVGETLAIPPML